MAYMVAACGSMCQIIGLVAACVAALVWWQHVAYRDQIIGLVEACVAALVTGLAACVATWWLRHPQVPDAQASATAPSPSHTQALTRLRTRFGRRMQHLGQLKKQGKTVGHGGGDAMIIVEECSDGDNFDALSRWSWLTNRKVLARRYHEEQMTLDHLKRNREAEYAQGTPSPAPRNIAHCLIACTLL